MVDRRTLLEWGGLAVAGAALRGEAWALNQLEPDPIAKTRAGRIGGKSKDGVLVFKGVPYGADTAGRRFMPPVAPTPWTDVKDCTRFGPMAPQMASSGHGGLTSSSGVPDAPHDEGAQSEDCLRLNVWTPGLRDGKKRPVLVYFHGGAYNNGTVNNDLYDGQRLCKRGDVVVVTVNHRINAFGYLYLGDLAPEYAESGNAGQLDLVMALKWVRENIAEFGGDAGRVLIFGQSGGGAKCAALMATPRSKGLFGRVMTMSGQQIKGASVEIAAGRAKLVLAKMGIADGTRGPALVAAIAKLTMEQIQEGARAVSADWLPVVDGVVLPRNPFDPDAPVLSEHVPMMLGNVHDETAVQGPADMNWEQAPQALDRAVHEYLGPVKAEEAVAEFRRVDPAYSPLEVVRAAATAFRAWPGQRMEAERRAANPVSQKRTWVYQMNFRGARGLASHTMDIPFMFDNVEIAARQVGTEPGHHAEAMRLAATMSGMLIRYAGTGDPNGGELPLWPTYDLTRRATMMWEATPRVEDDPRRGERLEAEKAHYHQAGTPLP